MIGPSIQIWVPPVLLLLCHLPGPVFPPDHPDPWEGPLPGPPLLLQRVAGEDVSCSPQSLNEKGLLTPQDLTRVVVSSRSGHKPVVVWLPL